MIKEIIRNMCKENWEQQRRGGYGTFQALKCKDLILCKSVQSVSVLHIVTLLFTNSSIILPHAIVAKVTKMDGKLDHQDTK